jgi:hypothetical protein
MVMAAEWIVVEYVVMNLMIETYCKICNKRMEFGSSMLGHIIEFHPDTFAHILIECNPSIALTAWQYYEEK